MKEISTSLQYPAAVRVFKKKTRPTNVFRHIPTQTPSFQGCNSSPIKKNEDFPRIATSSSEN